MARRSRIKVKDNQAYYHLYAKTAGKKDEFPFNERGATEKFLVIARHYADIYFCDVAAFCVMGNHYHLVMRFDESYPLSNKELTAKAKALYPDKDNIKILKRWHQGRWEKLGARLFDVSEFMRNIQMAFARWYNFTFKRKGRFWADRFKSTLLTDMASVLDCMLYVELNPVRAGLTVRPEDWKGSSFYLRDMGKDDWLVGLDAIFAEEDKVKALRDYRSRLYHRGAVPTKKGHKKIPAAILAEEEKRGFAAQGVYRKKLRYFTDGLVLGSEERLKEWIGKMRENGQYLRRLNPILQEEGAAVSLREQRKNFVDL